jgi:hypothetical protein
VSCTHFKAEQKLPVNSTKVQPILLAKGQHYQLSIKVNNMTKEPLEKEIHECQHSFITEVLVHEQSVNTGFTVCPSEVWANFKRATWQATPLRPIPSSSTHLEATNNIRTWSWCLSIFVIIWMPKWHCLSPFQTEWSRILLELTTINPLVTIFRRSKPYYLQPTIISCKSPYFILTHRNKIFKHYVIILLNIIR